MVSVGFYMETILSCAVIIILNKTLRNEHQIISQVVPFMLNKVIKPCHGPKAAAIRFSSNVYIILIFQHIVYIMFTLLVTDLTSTVLASSCIGYIAQHLARFITMIIHI